jgi:hypothetical protein
VRKINLKSFLLKLFIFGIILFPCVGVAESQILVQETEIDYEIIPINPEPYDEVTINLYSYAADIDKAFISWQSSNGIVQSGTGKKSLTFKAPGPDSTIYFDIIINPVEQTASIKKRIFINLFDMDVLWESVDSYTPPFYKGKALPSRGSLIKVVAVPNSKTVTSGIGKIDYTWKNNDDTLEENSGYNINSYLFKNSLFETINNIEVQASSVVGNYNANKTIEIPTYNPSLVFYKKSPTGGILFNEGIVDSYLMTEDQTTFVASPFYLATKGKEGSFDYSWYINGNLTPSLDKKSEITIRPNSRDGYIDMELTVENISELYQKITNSFEINF